MTTNPPGLRFWRVTLPKPPKLKYKSQRIIIDWVMAESWPNHKGPLMSQDSYVVLFPEKGEFVFCMKDTHEYVHGAGANKKTFNVRVEYHNAEGACLSKMELVPGLVNE